MQSVPITTKVVSLNPTHGEVYSIQHYVINFVSDLCQVSGFLWVLRFPQPKKLTAIYHDLKQPVSIMNDCFDIIFYLFPSKSSIRRRESDLWWPCISCWWCSRNDWSNDRSVTKGFYTSRWYINQYSSRLLIRLHLQWKMT